MQGCNGITPAEAVCYAYRMTTDTDTRVCQNCGVIVKPYRNGYRHAQRVRTCGAAPVPVTVTQYKRYLSAMRRNPPAPVEVPEILGVAELCELTGMEVYAVHRALKRPENPLPDPDYVLRCGFIWTGASLTPWLQANGYIE